MASVYDLLARCIDWATGNAKVQLTGSTVQDSQAIPMTQAQKDIVARAIDNIIDTIGAENIKLFLPMWETSGDKAYDLLNRNLTFSLKPDASTGPTRGVLGAFGNCMSFDGVNDCLLQDPVTENASGNTNLALDSGTKKLATRMAPIAAYLGVVRLNLNLIGSLPSATLRVVIYTDNAGVPGTAVENGTSNTLPCSNLTSSYYYRGFSFPIPPKLRANQSYWIVLEYADATDVDASNCVLWQYKASPSAYGQGRAVYDGATWTATAGEDHYFGAWETLFGSDDVSVILGSKCLFSSVASGMTFWQETIKGGPEIAIGLAYSSNGYVRGTVRTTSVLDVLCYAYPLSQYHAWGLTFSKAASTDKVKLYLNGYPKATQNGTENDGMQLPAYPLTIGAWLQLGNPAYYYKGYIGPFIITSSCLTDTQMAKVSHNLLILRKFGLEV